jgi:microcystin-dependent protein
MAQPYVGEIRIFAGNFPPAGWAFCDGQLLSIADNDVLFQLIGTTYGGDGQSTFGMPDMRGRVPVHVGTGPGQTYVLGQSGGVESVTLSSQQMPQHTHSLVSTSTPATSEKPSGQSIFADIGPAGINNLNAFVAYDGTNQVTLAGSSVSVAGGNQPHDNMQPYLGLNFIISLFGIFPSQN